MQIIRTLPLALMALVPTAVFAAPAPQSEPGCIVPQVVYTTLEQSFTLSVAPGPVFSDQSAWTLQLDPISPTAETASTPVISRRRLPLPIFRLTDGQLTTSGFPAEVYPTIPIFPPVLLGWGFGGVNQGTNGTFLADYTCDAQNNIILRLRALGGASGMRCSPSVITYGGTALANHVVLPVGFAVESFSELQRVWIKPEGYQGEHHSARNKCGQCGIHEKLTFARFRGCR